MPRLSILMSAYNVEQFVKEAIQSILDQTFSDFELLIADDGSKDRTRSIIDKIDDHRIRRFHNETNLGKVTTINMMFKESCGEFITIHDADDFSDKMRFELQVNALEENETLVFCGCFIQRTDAKGNKLPIYREKPTLSDEILPSLGKSNTSGDASLVIRKSAIDALGEFLRPWFKTNEDYDLIWRLAERFKGVNLKKPLYFYRNLPRSLSKSIDLLEGEVQVQIVKRLAVQRAETGHDALQTNNLKEIERMVEEIKAPYKRDQTLIFREKAAAFLSIGMPVKAKELAFESVKRQPFRLINWRTWLYCLRNQS